LLGTHLGIWLDCSIGAAMVVAGAVLFAAAWVLAPRDGLLVQGLRRWRVDNTVDGGNRARHA
ncbi:MAG TPA: metal ABC transporter permease, partial [Acidobacteriota bacterium]|nr:metal ABC transporter permease [Acidobacteriota bacterium]